MATDSSGPGAGHEVRDVDIRKVTVLALALVLTLAAVLLLSLWTFSFFAAREARGQPPPSTLAGRLAGQLPPEPRLQGNPLEDLQQMRNLEEALLSSYGWVDREGGLVRIPVERAMELTVRRGLPARLSPEGGRR